MNCQETETLQIDLQKSTSNKMSIGQFKHWRLEIVFSPELTGTKLLNVETRTDLSRRSMLARLLFCSTICQVSGAVLSDVN